MSVEASDEDDEIIFCQVCKSETTIDHCDDMGTCPGNVICGECGNEIDMDGKPALLCGSCQACKVFIRGQTFEGFQRDRKLIQLQSVVVA